MPRVPRPGMEAEALAAIMDSIRADRFWDHLRTDGIRLVPGVGSVRPKVMLVGEAPGATENTVGRPFCGAAGRILTQLMELAGLAEEDTYITNVVKYRPPGNRTPTLEEIQHGHEYVRREFYAVGLPRVLVAAGATARAALMLNNLAGAARMPPYGQPYGLDNGFTLWPMYHPAFPVHQPNMRETVERHWEEFGKWLHERAMI